MTIAHVGNLGTALSSANNQSSLSITTSAAAEAGNLVVVIVAVDNHLTTTGESSSVDSITDSAGGNTWTLARGHTFSPGGAAQDGANVTIWYSRLTNAIANGGTITANFTNSATADATAMSAREFTVSRDVEVLGTNGGTATTGTYGSLNATTANKECLRVRAVALESNSATAMTNTASWTLFTQAVSGGGTSATEVGIRGEFRIITATGNASAPTGPTGDSASAYAAIAEVTSFSGESRDAGAGSLSTLAQSSLVAAASQPGAGAMSVAWFIPPYEAFDDAGIGVNAISDEPAAGTRVTEAVEPHSGEARFSGAGALSAIASLRMVVAATFQGEGTLSGRVLIVQPAFASFAGAGSMSIRGQLSAVASAVFAGAGALSAAATVGQKFASAQFQGAGSLSAYANLRMVISARFAGAGDLIADAVIGGAAQTAQATFQGAGALSAHARQSMVAQTVFAGAGAFSVTATQRMVAAASFAGAGSLSARAGQAHVAQAVFAGAGALSADSRVYVPAEATFQGAGALSVTVLQRHVQGAIFAGSGALLVDAAKVRPAAAATFSGAGALSARGLLGMQISAVFGGTGSLSANGFLAGQQFAEASFAGASNFTISVRARYAASVRFAGDGSMLVRVVQRHRASVRFDGAGGLAAEGTLPINQYVIEARFAGAGDMSVFEGEHIPQVIFAEAVFAGEGTLRNTKLMYGDKALVYDFPIGRSLKSDYGIRGSKTFYKPRLVIGRR